MSFLRGLLKGGSKLVRAASKIPGVKSVVRAVPIVGTAYGAYEAAKDLSGLLSKPKAPPVPALPALPSSKKGRVGKLPIVSKGGSRVGTGGLIPWWRGPGGKFQMPWADPKTLEALEPFTLDDSYLRTYHRAPHGYVVIKDRKGRPYPVLKVAAKAFGLWHEPDRPPISVRDWNCLKRSNAVINKFKTIQKRAVKVANFKTTRTVYKTKGKR